MGIELLLALWAAIFVPAAIVTQPDTCEKYAGAIHAANLEGGWLAYQAGNTSDGDLAQLYISGDGTKGLIDVFSLHDDAPADKYTRRGSCVHEDQTWYHYNAVVPVGK